MKFYLKCSSASLITTLILMSMAGILASDIYVTALPEIATHFHAGISLTQQSLSLYLFSLALFQLLYGPLANIYGNTRVVFFGFLLFTIASLACLLSNSISILIFSRFFQAAGACSGMVISIAIVGQLFNKQDAAKILSIIFPFVALSTAVSPVIGGYLTTFLSWRGPFAFITIFGVLVLVMILLCLKKTHEKQNNNIKLKTIYEGYKKLLSEKLFIYYVIIACCGYVAYFIYFAQSPFIFAKFSLKAHEIGYLYTPLAIAYILGNIIANKLLKIKDTEYTMFCGIGIFTISGLLMTSMIFINYSNIPITLTCFMSLLTLGNGMFLPTSTACAVSQKKEFSNIASGFIGCAQLLLAAIGVSIIGHLTANKLELFVVLIFIITVVCLITAVNVYKKIK